MELLKFMNSHSNWPELLREKPYCLQVRPWAHYTLLKYQQFVSDMTLPEVQEARGCIMRQNDNGEWICVARAFDKFFNYGEPNAAQLDWANGVDIQEKIDGSLMKCWFDQGLWHISTNGVINANLCSVTDELSFGMLFADVLREEYNFACIDDFYALLDPKYTYMFELVSSYNKVVVHYKRDAIYYLGRRNIRTFQEDQNVRYELPLPMPKHFHYNSLEECVEQAHRMGPNEEGYVCVDKHYNRIKVKGDEYLRLHRLHANGNLSTEDILDMWQQQTLDDYMGAFPEKKPQINDVIQRLTQLMEQTRVAYEDTMAREPSSRKELAFFANAYIPIIAQFHFQMADNKVQDVYDFYAHNPTRTIARYI